MSPITRTMAASVAAPEAMAPTDAMRAEPLIRAAAESQATSPEYRAAAGTAAEKFEAYFIAQMLQQMRRTTRALAEDDGSFSSRANQDMLDMADTLVADALARQRAFGIADVILRQLLPPEPASAPATPLKEPQSPVASSR